MAKATATFETKRYFKRVETTVEELTGVTLKLSKGEAELLAGLLHRCGGSPARSHRQYQEGITRALRAVGVSSDAFEANGSVFCEEYAE